MGVKEERVLKEAIYMVETKQTVREIAKRFGVSKSTVHKDLRERLKSLDYDLYLCVDEILNYHAEVRHLRGGESTKKKYLKTSEKIEKS